MALWEGNQAETTVILMFPPELPWSGGTKENSHCPPQGKPQCHKEPEQTVLPEITERLSYLKANLEMRGVEALLQAVA